MTNWQYEYRAFMDADPTSVREALDNAMKADGLAKKVQSETDTYCVGGATNIAVRIRGSDIKMKGPVKAVDDLVDEMSDERTSIPVDRTVLVNALGIKADKHPKTLNSLDEIKDYMKQKGSKTSEVVKEMTKYEGPNLEVEVSSVVIDGSQKWTVCVASHDPKLVRDAVEKYSIKGVGTKMCYAEAVKQMGK
jgi:hypothetical protein